MKYFSRKMKIYKGQKPLSFTLQGTQAYSQESAKKYSKYTRLASTSSFETFQLLMMVGFEGSETYH